MLTFTLLVLSITGAGLFLKLIKQPPMVGYIPVRRDSRKLVYLVNLDNGFQ